MPRETSEERRARKEREKERAKERKERKRETSEERAERKKREAERKAKASESTKDRDKESRKHEKEDKKKSRDKDEKHRSRDKDEGKEKERKDRGKEKKEKEKDKKKDENPDADSSKKHKSEASSVAKKLKDAMKEENERVREKRDRSKKEKSKETSKKEKKESKEKPTSKLFEDAEKAMRRQRWEAALARGLQLIRMLELDTYPLECEASDIQPLTEYELFITQYGGSGRAQIAVQVPHPDDLIPRGVQTEDVSMHDRDTTMPDDFGTFVRSRMPDQVRSSTLQSLHVNHEALTAFLLRTYPVFHTLLNELALRAGARAPLKKSNLGFSEGYAMVHLDSVLGHRPLIHVAFSPNQPQYLLAVYAPPQDAASVSPAKPHSKEEADLPVTQGVIALWNVNNPAWPDRFLVSSSPITTACFSPTRPHIVYAGGTAGDLMVWDLREPDFAHSTGLRSSFSAIKRHHKRKRDPEEKQGSKGVTVLRYPTFTTLWTPESCHPFPIQSVTVTGYNSVYCHTPGAVAPHMQDDETESVAVLDAGGLLSFWVLQEVAGGEHQVSERDFGLAPYGRVKLLRSSLFEVRNPYSSSGAGTGPGKDDAQGTGSKFQRSVERLPQDYIRQIGTGGFEFVPGDSSRYLIGTDTGYILHLSRFNAMCDPPLYISSQPNPCLDLRRRALEMAQSRDPKYGTMPTSIAFSPHDPTYFIAGYTDGTISLYREGEQQPLFTFTAITHRAILKVGWVHSWRGVFLALSDDGTMYLFDLFNDDVTKRLDVLHADPMLRKLKHSKEDEVDMPLTFDVSWDTKGETRVAVAYKSGAMAIHVLRSVTLLHFYFILSFLFSLQEFIV